MEQARISNSPWKEVKKLDAILKLDQTAKLCQEPSQRTYLARQDAKKPVHN